MVIALDASLLEFLPSALPWDVEKNGDESAHGVLVPDAVGFYVAKVFALSSTQETDIQRKIHEKSHHPFHVRGFHVHGVRSC
jgi:hypothetical protein